MEKGKFFVIDGIDGSGKSTQTKLLEKRLKDEGHNIVKIDFPQYGKKSAGLVEEYLNGNYGSAEEVGPYRASIFYACDRYDADFQIKKWLEEGKIVVSDRYVSSNIGHQGGKIKNKEERDKYLEWLFNLEYEIFKISKPDHTFILKTSAEYSSKLVNNITDQEKIDKKKLYLGDKKEDIHEEDIQHLTDALNSYLEAAKEFPEEFHVIECLEDGKLLSPEVIHERIWKAVKEKL